MSDLLEFIREIKDLPLDMKNKLIEMRSKQMELDHIQAKLALEKNKVNIGEIETKKENEGTYADLNVDANANDETRELCGVCCSPIVDPIFLNCLHRFCSKCFDSFPEHNVVNCPLCRHPIEIEREMNMIFQKESNSVYTREFHIDIFECTLQWYAIDVYISSGGFCVKIRLPDKEKKEIDKVIDKCNNYLSSNGNRKLDRVYFYERYQGTKQFMNISNRSGFVREGIYKADITLTIHSIKCSFSGTHLRIHLNEIHIKGGRPPQSKTCSII